MKISALLCIIMLLSVAHGEDALTFDFATPIILDPILQHMRENLDDGVKGESYLSFSRPIQVIFTISRMAPDNEEPLHCERIEEITYDIPDKNTFRLYYDTGLIVMIRHVDSKGKVTEHRQTIRDKIEQIHFDDDDYERLSKDCLLKVYMGESPFRLLHDGKHKVTMNYKFTKTHGMGNVNFHEAALEYKFSYHSGRKIYNAAIKSSRYDTLVYSVTIPIPGGNVRLANVLDNSPQGSGFDCTFHDDMGLMVYSQINKGIQKEVAIWGPTLKEKIVYDIKDWMDKGMPVKCKDDEKDYEYLFQLWQKERAIALKEWESSLPKSSRGSNYATKSYNALVARSAKLIPFLINHIKEKRNQEEYFQYIDIFSSILKVRFERMLLKDEDKILLTDYDIKYSSLISLRKQDKEEEFVSEYELWWNQGRKRTPEVFAKKYQAYSEARKEGNAKTIAHRFELLQDMGIIILPNLLEKIEEGDKTLLPMFGYLSDNEVKNDVDCLMWWEKNKRDYKVILDY